MNSIPNDTRYLPLTQQKWLCVPTCIQMIMIRQNVPLVAAELLGDKLGLVVPEEDGHLFWNARSGAKPSAGWGTQAGKPQYGPNAVFRKLGIPFRMTWSLINKFEDKTAYFRYLEVLEGKNVDVLACFDWGVLFDKDYHGGHMCVLDKVDILNREVRLIDPDYNAPKWRILSVDKLFDAMKYHGADKSAGFWEITLDSKYT